MVIEASVVINAALDEVWDTFTDLMCWKDWCSVVEDVSYETRRLTAGNSFRFCMRPFDVPLNIEPHVEEVKPKKLIIWTGKKHGVSARHEFNFTQQNGSVLLSSRETFSGLFMTPLRLVFPEKKLKELALSMLKELKAAVEASSQQGV